MNRTLNKGFSFLIAVSCLLAPMRSNAADFLSMVNLDCVHPQFYPKGCMRVRHGHLEVGLKVTYWLPVGVMEVTPKACDFFNLGFLSSLNPLTAACNSFPSAQGEGTQNWMASSNYMRDHVHIYMIPKPVIEALAQMIQLKFHLPCFSFGLDDVLSINISPELDKALSGVSDADARLQVIKSIGSGFSPVFISELVSPIWMNDLLSPDTKMVTPLLNASLSALMQTSPPLGALTCPTLAKNLNISTPLIDTSFICVGYWGYGYPRIGVVRHDDYKIANALAGVRFWHLFSKTIPIISDPFSYEHKLQVAYPAVSGCFSIGDSLLPQLALTYSPDRKTVFIIWKEFGCCA